MTVTELPHPDRRHCEEVQAVATEFVKKLQDFKGFIAIGFDAVSATPTLYMAGLNRMETCYLLTALDAFVKQDLSISVAE